MLVSESLSDSTPIQVTSSKSSVKLGIKFVEIFMIGTLYMAKRNIITFTFFYTFEFL